MRSPSTCGRSAARFVGSAARWRCTSLRTRTTTSPMRGFTSSHACHGGARPSARLGGRVQYPRHPTGRPRGPASSSDASGTRGRAASARNVSAGAPLARARMRHLRGTNPNDRDRGCLSRSLRCRARTGQCSSRLCDRWRHRAPPENLWVEALTPSLRASPIPRRASPRGMVKRPCVLNGLEKRGGGGGRQGGP
jgi:hypothetical protein